MIWNERKKENAIFRCVVQSTTLIYTRSPHTPKKPILPHTPPPPLLLLPPSPALSGPPRCACVPIRCLSSRPPANGRGKKGKQAKNNILLMPAPSLLSKGRKDKGWKVWRRKNTQNHTHTFSTQKRSRNLRIDGKFFLMVKTRVVLFVKKDGEGATLRMKGT
jgi:hypothetical protein